MARLTRVLAAAAIVVTVVPVLPTSARADQGFLHPRPPAGPSVFPSARIQGDCHRRTGGPVRRAGVGARRRRMATTDRARPLRHPAATLGGIRAARHLPGSSRDAARRARRPRHGRRGLPEFKSAGSPASSATLARPADPHRGRDGAVGAPGSATKDNPTSKPRGACGTSSAACSKRMATIVSTLDHHRDGHAGIHARARVDGAAGDRRGRLFTAFPFSGELNLDHGCFRQRNRALTAIGRRAASRTCRSARPRGSATGRCAPRSRRETSRRGSWQGPTRRGVEHACSTWACRMGRRSIAVAKPRRLAAANDTSRHVGSLYGFDDWTIGRRAALDYGAGSSLRLHRPRRGCSARASGVTLMPVERHLDPHARVAAPARAGRRRVPAAPQRRDDPWLPPSARSRRRSKDGGVHGVERVRHVEISVEREFGRRLRRRRPPLLADRRRPARHAVRAARSTAGPSRRTTSSRTPARSTRTAGASA